MEEIWKAIVGYENFYEVSSMGRIRAIGTTNREGYCRYKTPKILSGGIDKDGYVIIVLCNGSTHRTKRVHRIVANHFIPNPDNLPCINHRDENKRNNSIENLEWCTTKYNDNYGSHNTNLSKSLRNHPLKSKPVIQLTKDGKFVAEYPSAREAQRVLKIKNISTVCNGNGRLKSSGGYLWKWK